MYVCNMCVHSGEEVPWGLGTPSSTIKTPVRTRGAWLLASRSGAQIIIQVLLLAPKVKPVLGVNLQPGGADTAFRVEPNRGTPTVDHWRTAWRGGAHSSAVEGLGAKCECREMWFLLSVSPFSVQAPESVWLAPVRTCKFCEKGFASCLRQLGSPAIGSLLVFQVPSLHLLADVSALCQFPPVPEAHQHR